MINDKKPFEIARETLKLLTARKLSPTPSNYQSIYNEVAGVAPDTPFPADRLRDIAQSLPVKTPGQQKQKGLLDSAIGNLSWDGVKNALMAYGGFSPPAVVSAPLPAQAQALSVPAEKAVPVTSAPALTADFFEQIARLIHYASPALGHDDERFNEQTQLLIRALRQPGADAVAVKLMLSNFGSRLSFAAEDQAEIKTTLLKLLHLIIENIGELSVDDQWLKGQVDALLTASAPPLSLRRLDDVERRLKDVIFKQTEAKGRALHALWT